MTVLLLPYLMKRSQWRNDCVNTLDSIELFVMMHEKFHERNNDIEDDFAMEVFKTHTPLPF